VLFKPTAWVNQRYPASKLTTARLLDGTTATSSLGKVLALGKVDESRCRAEAMREHSCERIIAEIAERMCKRKTARNFSIWCIYRRIPCKPSAKPVTVII
jgi:hypothetical protein